MFALIGKAITRWSFVEENLGFIYYVCTSPVACGPKGGLDMSYSYVPMCAFYSLESFRAKLSLVDAALVAWVAAPDDWSKEIRAEWAKLHDKTRKLSLKRNRLAHHTVLPGYDGEDYSVEPRLVPPIGSPRYYRETGLRPGRDTKKPHHVEQLIRAFALLQEKLRAFAEKLAQHEGLFDKYVEQLAGQIWSHSRSDPKRKELIERALSSHR